MPHLNQIRRGAFQRVGVLSDAEDITQEVYLIAWSAFDRYECGTNCKAWLKQILLYAIQRYRRKQARYRNSVADDFFDSLLSRPKAQWELSDPKLIAAVQNLPHHLRIVIQVVDIDGASYLEASATLGIPIGTVMSRLSRARKRLRSMIDLRTQVRPACADTRSDSTKAHKLGS